MLLLPDLLWLLPMLLWSLLPDFAVVESVKTPPSFARLDGAKGSLLLLVSRSRFKSDFCLGDEAVTSGSPPLSTFLCGVDDDRPSFAAFFLFFLVGDNGNKGGDFLCDGDDGLLVDESVSQYDSLIL